MAVVDELEAVTATGKEEENATISRPSIAEAVSKRVEARWDLWHNNRDRPVRQSASGRNLVEAGQTPVVAEFIQERC